MGGGAAGGRRCCSFTNNARLAAHPAHKRVACASCLLQTYTVSGGACGYGDLPTAAWPFDAVAAIDQSASPFATGAQQGCGACLEVQCTDQVSTRPGRAASTPFCGGPATQRHRQAPPSTPRPPPNSFSPTLQGMCGSSSPTVVVLVTDGCKGCGADTVYITPTAYTKAIASTEGQAVAQFRRVNCQPGPGGIDVRVNEFRATEGGWVALTLLDVAGSGDITRVEVAESGQARGGVGTADMGALNGVLAGVAMPTWTEFAVGREWPFSTLVAFHCWLTCVR